MLPFILEDAYHLQTKQKRYADGVSVQDPSTKILQHRRTRSKKTMMDIYAKVRIRALGEKEKKLILSFRARI